MSVLMRSVNVTLQVYQQQAIRALAGELARGV
jgi:hypothetical protein